MNKHEHPHALKVIF